MADATRTGRLATGTKDLAIRKQRLQVMTNEQQCLRYEIEIDEMRTQIAAREESIVATQERLAQERLKLAELEGSQDG